MLKTFTQVSAVMGLALGASLVTPTQPAVQAAGRGSSSDCGGLGQKTCVSVWPSKRCDAGLVEKKQRGRNICVKPSAPGDKTGGCGGLNETTCISVLPSKRCDAGLIEVRQRGRNICIKDEIGADQTPSCGGIGQASCWSLKASEWCDPGLIYKPGGIPGKGLCYAPKEDDMIARTRATISRFNALPKDNEFSKLRKCLVKPSRLKRLREQMEAKSSNGTNAIIRECEVNIARLQDAAAYVLDLPRSSAARSNGARSASSTQSSGEDFVRNLRLTLELSVDASFFKNSAAAAIGYAIPMNDRPLGTRWYKSSDDFKGGVDVGVGGDLMIGFGFPGVPDGDYVVENGVSGVVGGALGLKLAATLRGDSDNGGMMFGVFGGAGLGVSVAMYEYQNEFFEDKD